MTTYLMAVNRVVRPLGSSSVPDYPAYSAEQGPRVYLRNEVTRRGLGWAWELPGLAYLRPPADIYNALQSLSLNQYGKQDAFLGMLDEVARAGASPYVVERPGILWGTAEHQQYLPVLSRLMGNDTARVRAAWQWAWSSPGAIAQPANLVAAITIYQAAASGKQSTHDPITGQAFNPIIAASAPALDTTLREVTQQGLQNAGQLSDKQAQQYQPSDALKTSAGVGNTIMGGLRNVGDAAANLAKNAPVVVIGVVAVLGGLLVLRFVPRRK